MPTDPMPSLLPAASPVMAPPSPLGKIMARGPQYTILADNNHFLPALRNYLRSSELFNDMAQANVKHAFYEMSNLPAELYALRSSFKTGRLTRTEYNARSLKIVSDKIKDPVAKGFLQDVLEGAEQRGIAVHFVDHQDVLQPNINKDGIYSCYNREFGKNYKADEAYVSALLRERLKQDYLIAGRIKELAGKEKSVVVWGAQHMRAEDGLDAHLGRDRGKAQVILPINRDSNFANPEEAAKELGLSPRRPDAYYRFDTKKLTTRDPRLDALYEKGGAYAGTWAHATCHPDGPLSAGAIKARLEDTGKAIKGALTKYGF